MSKQKKHRDPYSQREAKKYAKPIPSREFIMELLRERGKPATRGALIDALGLTDLAEQEALRRRLRAMERDGQLVFTRKGGYGLVEKMGLVAGRVSGHQDGFGFLIPDDGSTDIFLSARNMRAVFHGDKILVRANEADEKGRREGDLVQVLERKYTSIAGRYFEEGGVGFVIPENKRISQDIIVPPTDNADAKHGQMVVVEILAPPTFRTQPVGRVSEILGEHMAPGMEIDVAIRGYDLPFQWSEAVIAETAKFPKSVTEAELEGRKDFRDKPFVTIDGEDAKDFDDAVQCEARPKGGWLLRVAIADVSHYVQVGSALDTEAHLRGNSVYFPGRVIPMLPEALSNELCSLRPQQDRLAMVCEMSISATGRVTRSRFYEAVIFSHARLTYTNVEKILVKGDKKLRKQYADLVKPLENLYDLFKVLREQRTLRGALDFDTTETQIVFGPNRKIQNIIPRQRNDAHRLIEECMLLANVCASKFLAKAKMPTLYRVHHGPTAEKLTDLRAFLAELGLSLSGGKEPKPKDYATFLETISSRTDMSLVQTVLLRSLSQAVYTPENKGHFGLAYDCYAHFTSPIRRYPDLLVHRAIRHCLQQQDRQDFHYDSKDMQQLGEHCSVTERRADDATRDVTDWLKCEYMSDKVGESFTGMVTGVTSFGLFLQLTDVYVEGLLHISELPDDYYVFDAKKHRLIGERTGHQYGLTDVLKVTVARVDLEQRKMDFILAK